MILGETIGAQLREDFSSVDADLEGSSTRLDELDLDIREGGFEFGDQTGRLWLVVSLRAVFDGDLHRGSGSGV